MFSLIKSCVKNFRSAQKVQLSIFFHFRSDLKNKLGGHDDAGPYCRWRMDLGCTRRVKKELCNRDVSAFKDKSNDCLTYVWFFGGIHHLLPGAPDHEDCSGQPECQYLLSMLAWITTFILPVSLNINICRPGYHQYQHLLSRWALIPTFIVSVSLIIYCPGEPLSFIVRVSLNINICHLLSELASI